jgi:hypothetical protein
MPSDKKVIALRLDDATDAEVRRIAGEELRTVANMAEILIRAGLRDLRERAARGELVLHAVARTVKPAKGGRRVAR